MATQTALSDHETRHRLLNAAQQLFSEHGFEKVTVRDICKAAGANLASVNYHFRDKWGLYKEVMGIMIDYGKRTSEMAHEANEGVLPEDRLRHYIKVFLHRLLGGERKECWQGKLIGREMTDPSPGLDLFVDQVIRPNSARVAGLVSELMGCPPTDPRVGMCVGSIQTQMVGLANPVASRMIPGGRFTPEIIDALASHIAEFSLGGIRAMMQKRRPPNE